MSVMDEIACDNWFEDINNVKCHLYFNGEIEETQTKRPLREKNKHVPHSQKPLQVVANRNARERRRVHAVNNAFVKLKNAIPIQNTRSVILPKWQFTLKNYDCRGKRISKVKTLLYAIDYIRTLDGILRECAGYSSDCYDWGDLGTHESPGNWSYSAHAAQSREC
ncbi:helix-loop-helix protein 6-like isoform X1 [Euwallacea similis]|uniref:helix-loop-helix protein 6-like isoform X1 n=1 Tax=Euwallacea similis TaxID=1736056 RepID=UPI00344EBD52